MTDTSSRPGCICSAFSDSDPNCPVCHPKRVILTSKENTCAICNGEFIDHRHGSLGHDWAPKPESVTQTRAELARALARDLRQLGLESAAEFVESQQRQIESDADLLQQIDDPGEEDGPWAEGWEARRGSHETPEYRKWPGEPPHCMSCDCGMTDEQKRTVPFADYQTFHTALMKIKYESVSLADAQVVALEALQRKPPSEKAGDGPAPTESALTAQVNAGNAALTCDGACRYDNYGRLDRDPACSTHGKGKPE